MADRETIKFRVRNKQGQLSGVEIENEVPKFDWQTFKNSPNANEFVKKAYYSAVKKIMREIHEGNKNGTQKSDLVSFETVITRSIAITKNDILSWIKSRDLEKVPKVRDNDKIKDHLSKYLPELARGINVFGEADTETLIDRFIPIVADDPTDPIADYLYSVLTIERKDDAENLLSFL